MATYWITFRIADNTVGGRTYDDRYESFTTTILASSSSYWDQTTSFYIFESDLSIDALASILKMEIAPTCDLFVIRELGKHSARIYGHNDDKEIFVFMPYLKST